MLACKGQVNHCLRRARILKRPGKGCPAAYGLAESFHLIAILPNTGETFDLVRLAGTNHMQLRLPKKPRIERRGQADETVFALKGHFLTGRQAH